MARKRSAKAPRKVAGLPENGRLYGSGSRKAAAAMMKEYGATKGKKVFYALANKRNGKGARGANRMHNVANAAYAKGRKFPGSKSNSRRGKQTLGRRRVRG